jgi:hypothetical protein
MSEYNNGEYTMLNAIANGAKVRRSEVERVQKLARFADELVNITQELRRTADVIEMIESVQWRRFNLTRYYYITLPLGHIRERAARAGEGNQ